jgi:hypothetical protein
VFRFNDTTAAYPRSNRDGVLLRQNRSSHGSRLATGRRYTGESGRPSDRSACRTTPGDATGAEWLRHTQPALPRDAPDATVLRSTTSTDTPARSR